MFEKELKEIDPLEYADDEFRDIYQRIGVDAPEEGYDGKVRFRSKNKRGALMVENEDEDDEEEEEEEEEEQEVEEVEEEEDADEEEAAEEIAEQKDQTEEDQTTEKAEERSAYILPLCSDVINLFYSEANNEDPKETHEEESPAK